MKGPMNSNRQGYRSARIVLPAIIAAAAVIRMAFLVQISGSDLGEILPLDMRFYHELGSSMAAGGVVAGTPRGTLVPATGSAEGLAAPDL